MDIFNSPSVSFNTPQLITDPKILQKADEELGIGAIRVFNTKIDEKLIEAENHDHRFQFGGNLNGEIFEFPGGEIDQISFVPHEEIKVVAKSKDQPVIVRAEFDQNRNVWEIKDLPDVDDPDYDEQFLRDLHRPESERVVSKPMSRKKFSWAAFAFDEIFNRIVLTSSPKEIGRWLAS